MERFRAYIHERETGLRRWTDKPAETEAVSRNDRRRVRRDKGKRLQRPRSELLERSFAHVCEAGDAKRTWLRGLEQTNKGYQIHTAARNLGLLMRDLFGIGKPRVLQDGLEALEEAAAVRLTAWIAQIAAPRPLEWLVRFSAPPQTSAARNLSRLPKLAGL